MDIKITFYAESNLIARAHAVAKAQNTSLDEAFRIWLERYADGVWARDELKEFDDFRAGRKFNRTEMNER